MRQPAGIVWTELQFRRWARLEALSVVDVQPLVDILNALEHEFPEEVAFERELWRDAAWLVSATSIHTDSVVVDAGKADPAVEGTRSEEDRPDDATKA